MSTFISVPAADLEAFLVSKGFKKSSFMSEIVYIRPSRRCEHTTIKVYTSLSIDAKAARGCGEDAIRVVAIFERKTDPNRPHSRPFVKCIHKAKAIHRTGSVEKILARILERVMTAVEAANTFLDNPNDGCFECRARAKQNQAQNRGDQS